MVSKVQIVCFMFAILLTVFCYPSPVMISAKQASYHILFLHAFTPDYPADVLYDKGVKSRLAHSSQDIFSYSYEYLNLARHTNDEAYFSLMAQYLQLKYADKKPDFIVTSSDLNPLILKYGNHLFPDVPIITAWNEEKLPLIELPDNYVAIPLSIEMDKNIQLILQTRPSTQKIYVVFGDSDSERNIAKRLSTLANNYRDQVELVFMNKLPYIEMLKRISHAEDDSAILYFQWFTDIERQSYIPSEVMKVIYKHANVPIYATAIQYFGHGMVGGYVNNFEKIGETAADAVLNLIRGGKSANPPVIRNSASTLIFDWRELKRWEINEHRLPSDSNIEYRETTIWELYGGYIAGGMITLVLQALLIFGLLINKRRRKKAENELLQANLSLQNMAERLISLDKLKDEFLTNTSHELRTPLNGIINITQSVLEGDTGSLTPAQKENLDIVKALGCRLYNLINDILDISRLKQGEIELDFKPIHLRSAVSTVIYVLEFLLNGKALIIRNDIPNNLPAVFADEERLNQILYNLIGNAIKFTEKGTISICAELNKESIEVSVRDSGIGIPKEQLSHIFEPFVQINGDASRGYDGTGLGLSITQKLVELHRGEIWVQSELYHGSNFSFTLPVTNEPFHQESYSLISDSMLNARVVGFSNVEIKGSNSFSIMVIDDDSANIRAIMNVLALEGYSIRGVSDGREGLDLIENGSNFDLLILDLMMPGLTGFDVLKRVRKNNSYVDLPILILTAKMREEDLEVVFEMGANDFLKKPFDARELKARVKTLVQLKALIHEKVSAELMFHQAQIKPHFIFNALSIISSLSIREPQKAKELVLDLSDYLRASFDFEMNDGFTTLRKELELVHAYLAIEQARFKERLSIEFKIEGHGDCTIPVLSIQPLVENAIRHGIMPLIGGGKVVISVEEREGFCKISVKDDGVGISEEEISNILAGTVKKGHVGLRNIHKRLVSLYGKGLAITRKPEKGTKVEFIIQHREREGKVDEDSDC